METRASEHHQGRATELPPIRGSQITFLESSKIRNHSPGKSNPGLLGGWMGALICSVQFSSVTQSCPTLCDPMNRSTPGLPVHHQLPESTQTHVHRVSDAIQPSHPLSSPSPPDPNPVIVIYVTPNHTIQLDLHTPHMHKLLLLRWTYIER